MIGSAQICLHTISLLSYTCHFRPLKVFMMTLRRTWGEANLKLLESFSTVEGFMGFELLLLYCRVPEELPESIEKVRQDCMDGDPKLRPTAKELYELIANSDPDL